jgi:hypothetical protein
MSVHENQLSSSAAASNSDQDAFVTPRRPGEDVLAQSPNPLLQALMNRHQQAI